MSTMTNSQKASLVQQHEEPNYARIRDLRSEGFSQQEAEEIDSLERREAVLLELGARCEITAAQRDELDTIQSELLDLVGSPHATYAGTTFAGDGAPAGTEPEVDDGDEDETSVKGTRAMMEKRKTELRLCAVFLDRYGRDGDDACLRIALRHAQKATELEDRIDDALMSA